MKTALDTSVILDVLVNDPKWAEASATALQLAYAHGQLLIGECVLAEIVPTLTKEALENFLADWNIQFVASSQKSALLAGQMYDQYLGRTPRTKRVLPDFLIGAHAFCHADQLLARDRGYYRDYFTGLTVIEPSRG